MTSDATSTRKTGQILAQDIAITNPNGLKAVYANHFGVSATMTDLTLHFLEMGQVPSGKGGSASHLEVKAIVTIPMLMGSGLIEALQQALQSQAKGLQTTLKQLQEQAAGGKK